METPPQGKIGRYVIQGELGRGAMGVVYRALDPAIGRTVAVKTIRFGQFSDEREIKHVQDRMMREAQAAGNLSHNNIVTIYDIQHENGTAFIFMEFVEGDTLEKMLLAETAVDKKLILSLLRQAAEALDYAHKRGIVHRDVKPANIMVRHDHVAKIADFGIARIQSHSLTQTGQILGTPNYMSPEQISGKPVDGRADQYSLAVMLYEVLTGEKPFVADSLPTLLFRVVSEAPQPAPRLNPTLSPDIDEVMQRALAKNPADRFPTCTEFIQKLEAACQAAPGWTTLIRGGGLSQLTLAGPAPLPQAAPKPVILPQDQETIASAPFTPAQPQPKVAPPPPAPQPQREAAAAAPVAPVAAQKQFPVAAPAPASPRVDVRPSSAPAKPRFSVTSIICVAVAAALVGAAGIGFKLMRDREPGTPAEQAVALPVPETTPPAAPNLPVADAKVHPAPKPADPVKTSVDPTGGSKPVTPAAGSMAISIRTTPEGARVVIDDGKFPPCTSPCLLELPSGRHSATAMIDTYKTEMRIFFVPNDSAVAINLEKQKGMLEISSTPPGATITIDGAEQPQKSPARIPVVIGKHTVVISLPGKPPYTQTFEMRSEATISLQPNWAN